MNKVDLFRYVWAGACWFYIGSMLSFGFEGRLKKIACVFFGPLLIIWWPVRYFLFKPLGFILSNVFYFEEKYLDSKRKKEAFSV